MGPHSVGHFLVTFPDSLVTFSSLFAKLLLPDSFCGNDHTPPLDYNGDVQYGFCGGGERIVGFEDSRSENSPIL